MTTITEADVGWAASRGHRSPPLTPHHPPMLHSMRELLYTQGYPPSMTRSKMTTHAIALFSGGSSLMRSRGQKVQKRCRNDFPKVHRLPKLGRSSLSFGTGAEGAEGAGFSKTFPPTKVADSPNVIQSNSTTDIP